MLRRRYPPDPHCVFCKIVARRSPADRLEVTKETVAIRPRNPVVTGHVLMLPTVHVRDAGTDPQVTATTMRAAGELAARIFPGAYNLITSAGAEATQTVFHLHIHLVPRTRGDGLLLPWTLPNGGGAHPPVAAPAPRAGAGDNEDGTARPETPASCVRSS